MAESYQILWGDTHHNTYQHYVQDPPLHDVLAQASTYLDFYTGAYYTQVFEEAPPLPHVQGAISGLRGGHKAEQSGVAGQAYQGAFLEFSKDPTIMEREWSEFQTATADWNRPGEFVAFPGFEWQGDNSWGDHNVFFRSEGVELRLPPTLPELYAYLRQLNIPALAIPHHTAYLAGQRAPNWANCDDTLSPFAELFSIHGCSETDEEWVGLRGNSHMGPGVGGSTYQDALKLGLHLGAVCSTDNWTNTPGHWGHGLMACLATELTRDALWEAFTARRVYGVTGDRIRLAFTCNDAPMGSILPSTMTRKLQVRVTGADALDRIELLRNERVIATYHHQGNWEGARPNSPTRYKMRIELGWGPRAHELPAPIHEWTGELAVSSGRILNWEPCWVTQGQSVPQIEGNRARFHHVSNQAYVDRPFQGGLLFEIEAAPDAVVLLTLNGMQTRDSLANFAAASRLLWYRDESIAFLRDMTGLEPERAAASDAYYHFAHKAKIHRAVPAAGYTAQWTVEDSEPLATETHYRVRVEQRNGQRAWSSPIWISA